MAPNNQGTRGGPARGGVAARPAPPGIKQKLPTAPAGPKLMTGPGLTAGGPASGVVGAANRNPGAAAGALNRGAALPFDAVGGPGPGPETSSVFPAPGGPLSKPMPGAGAGAGAVGGVPDQAALAGLPPGIQKAIQNRGMAEVLANRPGLAARFGAPGAGGGPSSSFPAMSDVMPIPGADGAAGSAPTMPGPGGDPGTIGQGPPGTDISSAIGTLKQQLGMPVGAQVGPGPEMESASPGGPGGLGAPRMPLPAMRQAFPGPGGMQGGPAPAGGPGGAPRGGVRSFPMPGQIAVDPASALQGGAGGGASLGPNPSAGLGLPGTPGFPNTNGGNIQSLYQNLLRRGQGQLDY